MSTLALLNGFDTFEGQFRDQIVVPDGALEEEKLADWSQMKTCTNINQVLTVIDVHHSGQMTYLAFSGHDKIDFYESLQITDTTVSLIAKVGRRIRSSYKAVKSKTDKVSHTASAFVQIHGDQYIDLVETGATYFVAFVFHCNDINTFIQVSGELGGSGSIRAVEATDSLKATFSRISTIHSVNYSAYNIQIGADLPGMPVNPTLESAVAFAQKFSDSASQMDSTFVRSFTLRGYETVFGNPDLTSVIRNRNLLIGNPNPTGSQGGLVDTNNNLIELNERVKRIQEVQAFYHCSVDDPKFVAYTRRAAEELVEARDLLEAIVLNKLGHFQQFKSGLLKEQRPVLTFVLQTYPIKQSGSGGGLFEDVNRASISSKQRLIAIHAWKWKDWLGRLEIVYDVGNTQQMRVHGEWSDSEIPNFETGGDVVTRVELTWGTRINTLDLQFSKQGAFHAGNVRTGNLEAINFPVGSQPAFVGFNGSAGTEVDSLLPIAVRFLPCEFE